MNKCLICEIDLEIGACTKKESHVWPLSLDHRMYSALIIFCNAKGGRNDETGETRQQASRHHISLSPPTNRCSLDVLGIAWRESRGKTFRHAVSVGNLVIAYEGIRVYQRSG